MASGVCWYLGGVLILFGMLDNAPVPAPFLSSPAMIDKLMDPYVVGCSILLFYIARMYIRARAVWKQFETVPGWRLLISQFSVFAHITGEIKHITAGRNKIWRDKHKGHELHGWDIISSVGLLPSPKGGFYLADAQAIKMVMGLRQKFPKPVYSYRVLNFYGNNIVSAEFNEWKRHRKIVAPAFGEKNNKLAFEESVRTIMSLIQGEWRGKREIFVDDTARLGLSVALMIISAAGFGHRITWEDEEAPPGHKMSFKRAVETLDTGLFTKVLYPKWLFEWAPTERIREARDGFAEFQLYLTEMINERRSSGDNDERRDLLSNLVDANEQFSDSGEQRLLHEETIGNIFVFYIAGHGSSGHTLCFALSMLAVHQEEQEELYRHIRDTLPDGRPPTYEDIPRLKRVTATLYETLRMFPQVPGIPKYSAEDTSLVVGNAAGEKSAFPIPAGSRITVDAVGLHYNPRYWEDPFSFKPERFLGEWNRDAFVAFSGGPRACIGRGFFETTGLAALTTLIQHYRVEPHPKFAGEPRERLKEIYSQATWTLSLKPLFSSLVFMRRRGE